jgi:hypothetical protein
LRTVTYCTENEETPTGETSLFAVGRYLDELVRVGSGWRFSVHRVQLETRVLDAFTHLPL